MTRNARHAKPGRLQFGLPPVGRFALPVLTGVIVFGVVTAFAASLAVSSKTLSAGNATVTSCNATASVSYNTAYSATLPGYKVATTPVTTAAACNGLSYKVTLTGAGNASLAEVTGVLDASGNASPDFSTNNVSATNVTGVSVAITG